MRAQALFEVCCGKQSPVMRLRKNAVLCSKTGKLQEKNVTRYNVITIWSIFNENNRWMVDGRSTLTNPIKIKEVHSTTTFEDLEAPYFFCDTSQTHFPAL